jgi:cyclohexyl-isocyanide hydratase
VVLDKLRGDDAAKLTQLVMEYDPEPPFDAGSPESAGPALVQRAMNFMAVAMAHQGK